MTQNPDDRSTDPFPADTPGLEPGGGVPPGETPPMASSTSEGNGPTPAPREHGTPIALVIVIGAAVVIGVLFLVWAIIRATSL